MARLISTTELTVNSWDDHVIAVDHCGKEPNDYLRVTVLERGQVLWSRAYPAETPRAKLLRAAATGLKRRAKHIKRYGKVRRTNPV